MSRARELAKLANPEVFSVDTDNNVGVNSLTPDARLDVVGVVSATSFSGDGSQLTGIVAGANLSASSGTQRVVVTSLTSGDMTAAGTNADLTYATSTNTLSATNFSGTLLGNATGLQGTPSITVQDLTAEKVSIAGTLSYEDVTNINSVGIITANKGIVVPNYGVNVTGVVTATSVNASSGTVTASLYSGTNVNVTGIVTANSFSGDGSALTNLPASGGSVQATVSGSVADGDALVISNNDTVTGITTSASTFPIIYSTDRNMPGGMQVIDALVYHPGTDKLIAFGRESAVSNTFFNYSITNSGPSRGVTWGPTKQVVLKYNNGTGYGVYYNTNTNAVKFWYDRGSGKILVFGSANSKWLVNSFNVSGDELAYLSDCEVVTQTGTNTQINMADGQNNSNSGDYAVTYKNSEYNSGNFQTYYDFYFESFRCSSTGGLPAQSRSGVQGTTNSSTWSLEPSDRAAFIPGTDTLLAFARNANTPRIYSRTWNGSSWGGWSSTDISGIASWEAYLHSWYTTSYSAGYVAVEYRSSSSQYRTALWTGSGVSSNYVALPFWSDATNAASSGANSRLTGIVWNEATSTNYYVGRGYDEFGRVGLRAGYFSGSSPGTLGIVAPGDITVDTPLSSINDNQIAYDSTRDDIYMIQGLFVGSNFLKKSESFSFDRFNTTLNDTNFIGFSDGSYTNGQTATIKISGSVSEVQSGLTYGKKYYVQNNGTLDTAIERFDAYAGMALSASKLIVKG